MQATRYVMTALSILCFAKGLPAAAAPEASGKVCAMGPAHVRIPIPASGMAYVDGDESSGPCREDEPREWVPALKGAFLVDANFGIGSLRPWTITVDLTPRSSAMPSRGFCLGTSTLGWRTMLRYERTPLPWVKDLDADGASELLIWDSFPLAEDPAMMEHGLMAWVYKLDADGTFIIDLGLSRKMAAELAEAYREPLTGDDYSEKTLRRLREKASRKLEDFAQGRCRVVQRVAYEE